MRKMFICLALLCTVMLFCACAVSEEMSLAMNERITLSPDSGDTEILFTPGTNNIFTVLCAGADANTEMTLYDGETGQALAEGELQGFACTLSARLAADKAYTVSVRNINREMTVEVMRSALGRSIFDPLPLIDGYVKVIANARDVHWYSFEAEESGLYTIRTYSELDTQGWLVAANGETLAASDDAYTNYEKDFLLRVELQEGETYYVRVCAKGEETGKYKLRISEPGGANDTVESISVNHENLVLQKGDTETLVAQVSPATAHRDIMWISTNQSVVTIDEDGNLIAIGSGTAQIIAVTADMEKMIDVTVCAIPVEELVISVGEELDVPMGSQRTLGAYTLPEDSEGKLLYAALDENIATVSETGSVTGVAMGETKIRVSTEDGAFSADVTIRVTRAETVYRAYLSGIQKYEDGRERIGAANTTQGIYDMLQNLAGETPCQVTMRMDSTRGEFLQDINSLFQDAKSTDISIVYINCHGEIHGGEACLQFSDGKRLTAAQLEKELRGIRGMVVLLLDCCKSGCFIERSLLSPFKAFSSTKYRVITSATGLQDSYRISFGNADSENDMATVFARSLCDSAGWNLIKDRAITAGREESALSFPKVFADIKRRVKKYLTGTGITQDVSIYPESSFFRLFGQDA